MQSPDQVKLAVIGLGYVGLPLAVAFGHHVKTMGFDINARRVADLRQGRDATLEASADELAAAAHLSFSTELDDIRDCTVFIVTVPTPIDKHNRPDLTPLIRASESIGRVLKSGDLVIYESTVYPGATEDVCVPILEKISGLRFNVDFFCGYSPERINPGDKDHRLHSIVKVTSGSTPEIADFVDRLYRLVISAGTHKASSIKVAEAAKVIENTQRDLNIALVNELAIIFNKLGIDTLEVLEAAGTKWNFLPFRPGLVGGHCIGVDPYYLTHKAEEIRHHPEVILAGRRINDGMGRYIAGEIVKKMIHRKVPVSDAKVLVLGLTFKENCPDLRNSRVVDIVEELTSYGAAVAVYDPWANHDEAAQECGVTLLDDLGGDYDAIVLAVAHREFIAMGAEKIRTLGRPGAVLYDIKSVLGKNAVDARL
ncbi:MULTISPECIES: Vi polysaccharide biosynthesis UDP-N-acetylglucosamine C-6 dehydrogenase TviB [unclassified Iodidimonas]|jgi:UDP-N-acetyl-D-galactosamine dehydrogenase|uniref:Vi polysaccharide biosynthesis UDP-N-acetylglucosamine C-6 dehydrogenase TviB n=1 Tax=unclassified Iodidimonas TaxID=2626145 RepID=UPI002482CFBF|nr:MULTISPECIES: Vi polysaccharide biosynthesis UDP-N-acetylglucosamine C-6 dehydrogenase TviB [unclassified Iodidimonas]